MRFLKNPKFDPLEARTSGFTGSMGGKRVAGVVFGPKPTPDPNFIKIGVGGRTGVLHFLIFGLLKVPGDCQRRLMHYPQRKKLETTSTSASQPSLFVSPY